MIDVENVPAELLLLSGSRLCMGTVILTAGGAAMFGTVLLRNNAGTGVIARIIMIDVGSASGTLVLGPTLNSAAAAGAEAFADTRVFGEGTALKIQGSTNNLVFGSNFWNPLTDASGRYTWEPPAAIAVIAPGAAFSIGNATANLGITVNLLWIERQAQPSELNL